MRLNTEKTEEISIHIIICIILPLFFYTSFEIKILSIKNRKIL